MSPSHSSTLSLGLQCVGGLWLACGAVRTIQGLWRFLRHRSNGTIRQYAVAGQWAVVTGASDGIGRAFALELARSGFNVCVIARTMSKLENVVSEISSVSGRRALAIAFDFGSTSPGAYEQLFAQLNVLDISVLVNNVGMTHLWKGEFYDEVSIEDDERVVQVNVMAMMRMTKYIVPRMKKAGKGAIINISSLTAVLRVVPFFALYAATKSFVRSFSESLAFELKSFGIDVLTVLPGFVSTAMTQGSLDERPPLSFGMVSPDEVARDTLAELGRTWVTAGHRNHQLMQWIFEAIPKEWLGKLMFGAVKKESDKWKRKLQVARGR